MIKIDVNGDFVNVNGDVKNWVCGNDESDRFQNT